MRNKLNKTKASLLAFLCVCFTGLHAQDIAQLYINIPNMMQPILSSKQRMELIEYTKAGMGDSIQNPFGSWTYLTDLDLENNYIALNHVVGTEFAMKKMSVTQQPDSVYIVGIIESVCAPICASVVRYFDAQWNEIKGLYNAKHLFQATDFIDVAACQADGISLDEIVSLLPPVFLHAEFDKTQRSVIYTNNTIQNLSQPEQKKYSKYLKSFVLAIP